MRNNIVPKVLIFAHNPISYKTGNGKTIAAFFSEWPNTNLAQIYTNNLSLDWNLCSNYYRINEIELLKTILNKKYFGEKVAITNYRTNGLEKRYKTSRLVCLIADLFHTGIGLSIREYAWKRNFFKSDELDAWIKEFKPDVIFFTLGELCAEYNFVISLKKRYNIPVILYASDDYLSNDFYRISLIIHRIFMRKNFTILKEQSSFLVAISDAMALKFKRIFNYNKPIIVAMNCCDVNSNIKNAEYQFQHRNICYMTYIGNLGIGRWKVLSRIIKVILENSLNSYKIVIYSSFMPTEYILNNLNSEVSCFCGSVYGDSLRRVREESDVLIIVESFDKKYKNLLSTALSTKVPEYLASGKIILAIGPDYSAAISYIRANNAGYCLTSIDKRDILNMLDLILQDNLDNKMRKIQNALRLARSRHNTTEVSLSIMREIEKII